jgi:hypothetical protein
MISRSVPQIPTAMVSTSTSPSAAFGSSISSTRADFAVRGKTVSAFIGSLSFLGADYVRAPLSGLLIG